MFLLDWDWDGECFEDSKYESKNTWEELEDPGVDACKTYCKSLSMKYEYVGLQAKKCFCPLDTPEKNLWKPRNDCDIKCIGNEKDFCGGQRTISIYKVDKGNRGVLKGTLNQVNKKLIFHF